MDEIDLNTIADAWIAGEAAEAGTPERESNWWAITQVMGWSLKGELERLWQFILIAYRRDISEKVLANLAAGPLEDLLVIAGPGYIDRVEQLAKEDDKFSRLLGGVWRNSMTDEVWSRVQAVRKKFGSVWGH